MSSWGHAITPVSAEDKAHYLRQDIHCGVKGCKAPVTFHCSYLYVTGRAGRVNRAYKTRCQAHAEAFAKKHNLTLLVQGEGVSNEGPNPTDAQ